MRQKLLVVTDASLNVGHGAACVILETLDMTKRMIFITKVPSNLHSCDNDSYRCELCGIWAALTMIEVLEKSTRTTTCIKLTCDNLRAIEVTES